MGFFKGCLGSYLAVVILLFINVFLNPPFDQFYLSQLTSLIKELPSVIIYGSIGILPGCILVELLYSEYLRSKKIITGIIFSGFLGLLYGILIILILTGGFSEFSNAAYSDYTLLYFISVIGAIMFYLFRKPWNDEKKIIST